MKMRGKVAIVTGAASGIGKEIAKQFAHSGAITILADLDLKNAKTVADEIRAAGGMALAIEMDVTDEKGVTEKIDQVVKTYGPIDILVSNAGIQTISPIEKLSLSQWRKITSVHLDGAFLTTKACLTSMYASGKGGTILYIGSVHSKLASKMKGPYVSAKHGLEGLCKVVAKEGAAYNVKSNLICPGFVRTPLVEKQIPEQAVELGMTEEQVVKEVMLKDTVDGEFTTLDDIARVALFFATFESKALTGQSLIVSHGWCME